MAYIGNRPVVGRYASLDTLTFNGSNTNYTLTIGGQPTLPGSPQNLIIAVAGVVQSPGDAYTINGSTIQFTSAPANTASFWGVQLGDVYSVAVASNTGVASLRTSFTASNNQTTFTVTGGYVPGQIDVYRNGVKLVNGSDVNVSSGSTFVLASGAANNDVIEVIGAQSVTAGGSSTLIKQTFTANSTVNSSFAVTNGYTAGMIDVYVNGVKQVNGQDVNVSSGSNVVFTSALANGSIVDVTGYQALSVYNGYVFRNGDTMTGTLTVPKLYANNGVTDTAGYISTQPTMRNKIINGDMRIDQRNAGASVNPSTGIYTLDRWFGGGVHDGVIAIQRVADAPSGFVNSLRVTVSTADTSLAATQYARIGTLIEGYNVADFAGGTASATAVTLSFWVKSSLTGTFGGNLLSGDESRCYVFQYTINSANTWEQKTITATLATSGTWATDNSAGMRLFFSLGAGSTYTNTANTWLTSYAAQASGNVNVINTLGATFYITGVQLEKGSVATPFEYRNYQQELAMCQRYYEQITYNQTGMISTAQVYSTTQAQAPFSWKVPKRAGGATIALSDTSAGVFTIYTAGGGVSNCTYTFNGISADCCWIQISGATGLVAGNAALLYNNAASPKFISISSEL
jgi:hypothetical protein